MINVRACGCDSRYSHHNNYGIQIFFISLQCVWNHYFFSSWNETVLDEIPWKPAIKYFYNFFFPKFTDCCLGHYVSFIQKIQVFSMVTWLTMWYKYLNKKWCKICMALRYCLSQWVIAISPIFILSRIKLQTYQTLFCQFIDVNKIFYVCLHGIWTSNSKWKYFYIDTLLPCFELYISTGCEIRF